jgi:hypothetical protein
MKVKLEVEVEPLDQSDTETVRRSIKGVLSEYLPGMRIKLSVKKVKVRGLSGK